MTTLIPETGSLQYFRIRTRPAVSQSAVTSASIQLLIVNEETNQEIYVTPATASYDEYGFLDLTVSVYLTGSDFYTLRVNQLTGSVVCTELYRGELYATDASPVLFTSEPLLSYTGSNREQILNEYIIY
jgi:hypothetical protein